MATPPNTLNIVLFCWGVFFFFWEGGVHCRATIALSSQSWKWAFQITFFNGAIRLLVGSWGDRPKIGPGSGTDLKGRRIRRSGGRATAWERKKGLPPQCGGEKRALCYNHPPHCRQTARLINPQGTMTMRTQRLRERIAIVGWFVFSPFYLLPRISRYIWYSYRILNCVGCISAQLCGCFPLPPRPLMVLFTHPCVTLGFLFFDAKSEEVVDAVSSLGSSYSLARALTLWNVTLAKAMLLQLMRLTCPCSSSVSEATTKPGE